MMTDPKERALLAEKMGPNIVENWDAGQIAIQNEYLKLVHDMPGDNVLKTIPTDLIRSSYNPQ
jgi:hypothetical protein